MVTFFEYNLQEKGLNVGRRDTPLACLYNDDKLAATNASAPPSPPTPPQPPKFRGKYRIESVRLKGYDYSSDGAYFITICTKNREHFFGEAETRQWHVSTKMKLSGIGEIAKQFWQKIETLHDFIILDEWVIMPNHTHGIIFIQKPVVNADDTSAVPPPEPQFGKLPKKSISSIINHHKGAVKKWANENEYQHFRWQKNFYDHIIRNEDELNRIREYIFNNPANWEKDKNNEENLYM